MKILTFDIEEWWSYDHYSIGNKIDYLPRLERYLYDILDTLDKKGFQATFFCLGAVAQSYPKIIKDIAARGHEIGCHSYSHRFFGDATYEDFSIDTVLALDVIENIIGQKVVSYRAPAFSITQNNKWAIEVLIENGIENDCSIFPASRAFGGFAGFQQKVPSILNYNGKLIKEFPMSVTTIVGKELAYSGGGYFRLFPFNLIKSIMNKNQYVMTYFHLNDFDKEQKRSYSSFQGESAPVRYFKNYYGLNGNYAKFQRLLSTFDFISVEQATAQINWEEAPVILLDSN